MLMVSVCDFIIFAFLVNRCKYSFFLFPSNFFERYNVHFTLECFGASKTGERRELGGDVWERKSVLLFILKAMGRWILLRTHRPIAQMKANGRSPSVMAHSNRLYRSTTQQRALTANDMTSVMANPHEFSSSPLITFMP